MAKYGRDKYSTVKYGADGVGGTLSLSWALEIDWDNDGIFNGRNDGLQLQKLSVKRGRQNLVKSDGFGFERIKEGTFTATLLNVSGTYDPYNTGSELYPNVLPGKLFRLRVMDNSTNIIYNIMYGIIEDIRPNAGDPPTVVISGVDKLKNLKNIGVYVPLIEDIGTDEAMLQVLSAANWSANDYIGIDNATEYIPDWWANGETAYEALAELAEASLANMFIANDGSFMCYSKYGTPTLLYTLFGTDILREIITPQPWEIIRNAIKIRANIRNAYTSQTGVVVLDLQQFPPLVVGESTTIWTEFSYNGQTCAAKNLITLVSPDDLVISSTADGNGDDLSAQCSVTVTSYGETAKIEITNNSSVIAYVTRLRQRGDALILDNSIVTEKLNQTNINLYGRKELNLDNKWLQTTNLADDLGQYLRGWLTENKLFLTVQLKDNPAKQFGADLFSKILVNIPDKGIDTDASVYMINYIQHDWTNAVGDPVLTTFQLEPFPLASINSYWTFPVLMEDDTVFAY